MNKRNRTLIIIYSALGVLILSLIALTQSGCASDQRRPITTDPKGSDAPLIKAQVHNENVATNINAAMPFTKDPGTANLRAALLGTEAVDTFLIKGVAVVRWWADSWGEQYKTIEKQNTQIAAYRNQWIGDRAWRWIWGIVAVWAGLGVAAMLVGGFFPAGILGSVAGGVLRFLPVANLFVRGRDIIRAKQAGGLVTISRNVFGNKV